MRSESWVPRQSGCAPRPVGSAGSWRTALPTSMDGSPGASNLSRMPREVCQVLCCRQIWQRMQRFSARCKSPQIYGFHEPFWSSEPTYTGRSQPMRFCRCSQIHSCVNPSGGRGRSCFVPGRVLPKLHHVELAPRCRSWRDRRLHPDSARHWQSGCSGGMRVRLATLIG